jgi:hypothetical protein
MYQDVIAAMDERANSGEPDPDNWTCGGCGCDGADGVRMFTERCVLTPAKGRRRERFEFVGRLICPCCSFGVGRHVGVRHAS